MKNHKNKKKGIGKFFSKLKALLKRAIQRNLLIIKVKDINSIPEIIYQGKKIGYKKGIYFSWETTTENFNNGYDFKIEHYKRNKRGLGRLETTGFKSVFKDK